MFSYLSKMLLLICNIIYKIYKLLIDPIIPKTCRYLPSCSDYAIEAYNKYGFVTGSILTLKRLIRCNPFCKPGFDPVNDNNKKIMF